MITISIVLLGILIVSSLWTSFLAIAASRRPAVDDNYDLDPRLMSTEEWILWCDYQLNPPRPIVISGAILDTSKIQTGYLSSESLRPSTLPFWPRP